MPRRVRFLTLILSFAFAFVPLTRAVTNNLALTPPMGWNDWNAYHCGSSFGESAITNNAAIIVANGMKAAGYQYVDIDDGWASSRDSNGVIQAYSVAGKFPHGIPWLADYVHSKGLKLGVYTDDGTNTCSGCISTSDNPVGKDPGSFNSEYVDAFTYASYGADYLKDDNCNANGEDGQLVYGRMSDGLMKSGRPILFCLCGGEAGSAKSYQSWSPAVGNYWRTTGDIGPNFASMIGHIDPNSTSAFAAGPGRWNDPDMLEIGNGEFATNLVAAQTHFTMWCIMAAPLVMGNNLTTMSAGTLQILTNAEAIAVDQDPAGEQGIKVFDGGSSEVFSKPLGYDFTTRAVALLNRDTNNSATITCNFTNLAFQAGTTATVRDLWTHMDLGTFTNSFTATIPPYGSMLLKIVSTPVSAPSSIGTNYLSDLSPIYSYCSNNFSVLIGKDKSISGNTLTLAGTTYTKGIGVNSRSGVEYNLGGVCTRFQAKIGIDDESGNNGSVIFQVYADGAKIYDSGAMTGSSATKTIDLDMTGVRRLTLGIDDDNDGISNDHADWANALVIATNVTQMPHAPNGLNATQGNLITLNWNSTLAGLTYNVKRATQTGGPYTTITNIPITTFADSNIVNGTTYFYVVSAVSSLGESSNSVEVSAAQCFVPNAPTNVVKSATSISNIVIKWNQSPGAASYNVYRFTGITPPVLIGPGITATNFTDTPVGAAATNYYYVTAVGSCSESGWANFAGAVTPPAAPTGLTATAGNSQITLSWTAPPSGALFNVKRSTTSGGPYTTIANNISSAGYLDTTAANGTTYYYVVSAIDAGGEGPNSSQANAVASAPATVTAYWTNTITSSAQNWNVNGNWTNAAAFPSGISTQAIINANISAPQTINLNQPITVGSMQIGDANNSANYTIAANGGSLAFSDTNTISLTQISTSKGDVFATPISIATNLVVINNSTNPLTFAGNVSSANGATLTIGSGTFQVGDGTTNGSLGSVNVTDNTSLVFNRSDSVTNSGVISGSGSVTQNGTGTITLTASNTYAGSTLINSGTLALNAVPGGTQSIYVAPGSTFQLNANYKTLTLTGSGIWNVNANGGNGTAVSYSTSENVSAFTGTVNVLFGSRYWLGGQSSMPAGTMFIANGGQLGISYNSLLTGNIHIAGATWGGSTENDGALRLNSGNNSGGNFAGMVTLDDDAGIAAGQTNGMGTVSANISGAHTLTMVNGTITLSGNNNFGALNVPNGSTTVAGSSTAFGGGGLTANGTAKLNGFNLSAANLSGSGVIGNYHASTASTLTVGSDNSSTIFSGTAIDGSTATLALTKIGNGSLTLSGTNTYSGATTVNGGALIVSGLLAGGATVASAGTLGGNGSIAGAVSVNGILSPGINAIGTLTFGNNLTLNGGSSTQMKLNKSLATNDVVKVTGTLNYGGTLVLTNLSGALANGDSFKLFSAANYSGAFTNISPAIPGINLAWNTNGLPNGILSVIASPTPPPKIAAMKMSGNNFVLSGSNGVSGWPYYVLTSTNVSLPVTNWTILLSNTFDGGGNFNFTNPANGPVQQFYLLKLQ
jgi:alpha-galactosidase